MRQFLRDASLAFSAGGLGALANSIAVWLFGIIGITAALGVAIAPPLTSSFLYPRIVWGGLWGFLILLPFLSRSPFLKGLVLSIGPTLVQLLIVFPLKAGKGFFALDLGMLTPLFVVFYNAIWGVVAVYWCEYTRR